MTSVEKLLIFNTCIAFGYLVWGLAVVPSLYKNKNQENRETYSRVGYLIRTVVIALCPVVGALFFLTGHLVYRFFFQQDVDLEDVIFSKERKTSRLKADAEREGNLVPIEEALAVSDRDSVRMLVMNVIRGNIKNSLASIAMALNSEDSETSHYAASVLRDELNDFRQRSQELYQSMKKEEEDAWEYASMLLEYMNGVLCQGVFHELEQCTYVEMMEEACNFLYEKKPLKLTPEYVEWVCLRLLEIQNFEKMEIWCKRGWDEYPDELSTYTCQLKLCFTLQDRKRFFAVLNRLKRSDIVIDRETLELIRTFG